MELAWPTKEFRNEFLNSTIEEIGRAVDFYYIYSSYDCPTCDLDPVTNTSTDSFCPTCSGNGYLYVYSGTTVSGHVSWKYSENLNWYAAGTQMQGDCQVRVNYSPEVYTLVDKSVYVVVDEREMEVDKITLRGAPDYDRIIISLMQKEKPSA